MSRTYTDPKTLRSTRTTVKLGARDAVLMSRSEAKRVTERLTSFTHAVLDFTGVEVVGQGFCHLNAGRYAPWLVGEGLEGTAMIFGDPGRQRSKSRFASA